MIARGHVQNGIVILDEGVQFPEGQEVTVVANERLTVSSQSLVMSPHSVLDIAPVSVGSILRPQTTEDDLLEEMLDEQP